MSKQDLRAWAKAERKKIDIESLSESLTKKVKETLYYKQAKSVMLFYPKENEINLLGLIEDNSKKFYLPKIEGNTLLCCPYNDKTNLCESCFKTLEPDSEPVEKELLDLVIIPALAVDKNNYRLGYGGGFYDRFLSNLKAFKMVCIQKEAIVESVYPESHDVKIDLIVTL